MSASLIQALKDRIADRYKVFPVAVSNPDDFGRLIREVRSAMRAAGCEENDLPLYGDHINSGLSAIDEFEFVALLGIDDTGQLVTTNTARAYSPFDDEGMFPNIRWLLQSRRLWFDKPELVAPSMRCVVDGLDFRFDMRFPSILHVGTAWVHSRLRDHGLGRAMVALHRNSAYERFGAEMMFGTTKATKDGTWTGSPVFHGTATVTAADGSIEQQQIRIWSRDDATAAGERVLAT